MVAARLIGTAMDFALLSTYECGMQPLGLATVIPHLSNCGTRAIPFDDFILPVDVEQFREFDVVCFSVPLFDSLRRTIELADHLRESYPLIKRVFYGSYAALNAQQLLTSGRADAVVQGDPELALPAVARSLAASGEIAASPGVCTIMASGGLAYLRHGRLTPERGGLPRLDSYTYEEAKKRLNKSICGNVEVARGCRFDCSYCSVFATFQKKVNLVPKEVVIEDVRYLIDQGAEHICFVDAEFLNAPAHSESIVQSLHSEFPLLTFDFTSRADLLVANKQLVESFVSLGARFVTTAFEFPSQKVLDAIDKDFDVATIYRAIDVAAQIGLEVNPTFVVVNPFIEYEDVLEFERFVKEQGLEGRIEPIQLVTRLWLYKGSPLLQKNIVQSMIDEEHEFHFTWKHHDARVEKWYSDQREKQSAHTRGRCCLKC